MRSPFPLRLQSFFSWLFYASAVALFVLTQIYFPPSDLHSTLIPATCFSLIAGAIVAAISEMLSFKTAILYVFYWLFIGFSIEYLYLSNHLLEHHGRTIFILQTVPLTLPFYWLILFFGIYSLSTFCIKKISKKHQLIFVLLLDAAFMMLYTLLFEPLGQQIGLWTWHRSATQPLLWSIPIIVYLEYFIGILFVMFPIRWVETYVTSPKMKIYQPFINFPIYFGWSLFFVTALGAFYFAIEGSNVLGGILMIGLTIFLISNKKKRRYS